MHTTEQLNTALAGRYSIERLVGEGGMATVYLARDIKHNRPVALKVLKPDLGAVVGVERFLSEIQVTANLQHPNLLPLFDSGAADGLLFYVMPYVEGESLRARLEREKQLPIDDALHIATAVASALDYAHRHGVIHRDLKPENILLHEGEPLVADFGIALAVSNAGGNRITQTGLSLGTPQYMSPEQATGDRTIDARTDIYSLGAVTYEMLAGEAPHTGTTSQAIIARVLTEKPRGLRSSRPNVAVYVEGAVMHALEKLPADRWATAKEFSEALSGARPVTISASTAAELSATPAQTDAPSRRMRVRDVAGWVLATVGLAGTAYFATRREPTPVLARLVAEMPESVTVNASTGPNVAISRDGRRLVVVGVKDGKRALYVRGIDDPGLQIVRGTDGASVPGFSPDGQSLLFSTSTIGNRLFRIPITGGTAQLLTDSIRTSGSWGDGGLVVFERAGGAIWAITSDGANKRRIAAPDSTRNFVRYYLPEMLPGGHAALITIFRGQVNADSTRVGVVSLDDGKVTDLGMPGSSPHYASGWIIFARGGGNEYAAPFSLRKRAVTGPAVLLLQGIAETSTLRADVAVAENGTLVFHAAAAAGMRRMFSVDRQGVERPLKGEPALYAEPRMSPDGRHVAVRLGQVGAADVGDLWVSDTATGTLTRLTSDGASVRGEWSQDGHNVVYINHAAPDTSLIVSRPWDGNGSTAVLARLPGTARGRGGPFELSLGPPHGYSAIRIGGTGTNTDISLAATDSLGSVHPFVATPHVELTPAVSPNGHLLAYVSNESGENQVYLRPMPNEGPRVPVSVSGGTEPMWSRDGSTLFYRGPSRMMLAMVSERPLPQVTSRDSLFVDSYDRNSAHQTYDVSADGRRFLMTRGFQTGSADSHRLFVIVNWLQLIGKQTGTGDAR